MKTLLFCLSCTAIFLVSLLPANGENVRINQFDSLSSGSKVTVSGISIGRKLCNFPKCITAIGMANATGPVTVTGTVQRKWKRSVLMVEAVK